MSLSGALQMLVRQRLQIAATRAGCVHPQHACGDFVIGSAMGHGSFDGDDGEFFHGDALAVPLTEIEGRCLDAGDQNSEACMFDDGTATHVEDISTHAGKVAVFVLEFKAAIVQGNEFDFEFERACVQAAAFATEFDGASTGFELAD